MEQGANRESNGDRSSEGGKEGAILGEEEEGTS